jgi:hypothetical protein
MQMKTRFLWIFLVLAGCKEKKHSVSGDAPVKITDFIAAFKPLTLPFQVADTNLSKIADTVAISHTVIAQFIPDTLLNRYAAKGKQPKIHPVGRIERNEATYLLTSFTQGRQNQLLAFVLNKKNAFITSLPLLSSSSDDGYNHYVTINREPTFMLGREKVNKEKQLVYTRNGFAYNEAAKTFTAVINESNEDDAKMEILNPIDTLPRKNKYSGDYVQNKRNFISVRDGRNASTYLFFIHFEKNEGQCTGELKGELDMRDERKAIFHENGDPCVIDFVFSNNEVAVKEQGSCGNHRGVRCQFNDTYRKKKEKTAGKSKK